MLLIANQAALIFTILFHSHTVSHSLTATQSVTERTHRSLSRSNRDALSQQPPVNSSFPLSISPFWYVTQAVNWNYIPRDFGLLDSVFIRYVVWFIVLTQSLACLLLLAICGYRFKLERVSFFLNGFIISFLFIYIINHHITIRDPSIF